MCVQAKLASYVEVVELSLCLYCLATSLVVNAVCKGKVESLYLEFVYLVNSINLMFIYFSFPDIYQISQLQKPIVDVLVGYRMCHLKHNLHTALRCDNLSGDVHSDWASVS